MDALRLKSHDLERLVARLDALESHIIRRSDAAAIGANAKADVEGLLEEFLIALFKAINVNELERRFDAQLAIDIDGLDIVYQCLSSLGLPEVVKPTAALSVNVRETLRQMRGLIDELKQNYRLKSQLELRVAIDMKIGGCVRRLLIGAAFERVSVTKLAAFIRSKLDLLEDSQVVVLWAALQRELDSEALAPTVGPDGIISSDWRRFDSPELAKNKYADYVTSVKIRMMQRQQERGVDGFPINVHEVPDIATWKSRTSSERVTEQEVAIQISVARVNQCAKALFGRSNDDIANLLRIAPDSILLRPERLYGERQTSTDTDLVSLMYEMRKLAYLIDSHAARTSQIETALRQYKLGFEVTADTANRAFAKQSEIAIQRELAKFLIERGIYAAGTKFGRAEADLVSTERSDYFILEVKKFVRGATPTAATIKAALTQLQSYLDAHPTQPAGVLVLINLSSTLLIAPQKWLRGKFWIVAVNLLSESPSRRRNMLSIDEGIGADTIAVHTLASAENKSSPRLKRLPARKTPSRGQRRNP